MKKTCETNNLTVTHPEVAAEWHLTKNGNLSPDKVLYGQKIYVWWKCNVHEDHEWKALICNRTSKYFPGKCPFCCGQKVCFSNCLLTKNPDLAKEWHPTKNLSITPLDVTPGCNKKFWWQCTKEHEWSASVNNRNKGKSCPFCCNRKIIPHENSFGFLYPEIVLEWHPTKNLPLIPEEVAPGAKKSVWWQCSKNKDHIWFNPINRRTGSRKVGCPRCNESKGEKATQLILEELGILFEKQYKFKDCKNKINLRFDFALLSENSNLKGLIEYNGRQHYLPVEFFGGEENLQYVKKNDEIKFEFCKENNIPYLVIKYSVVNIKNKITNFLKGINVN